MKTWVFIISMFLMLFMLSAAALAQIDDSYEEGLKYYNTGKFEEAIKYFEEYVEEHPAAPAYYRLGYALYKLGRHDEAIKYFEEAYFIDPAFTPGPYVPKE
ncbi:MAG TPA: tetratricopeptide repeat protein [Nitrospirae bacterium]|nr:tetratricopeptide repeat protein [bacterium BMS3Abin10]GBE38975.1 tetratricopeptide repeat protein [bacterium BMS3Bbin08]HDH51166.1 tetratricopeptide repeat protein [Nitrospirota bacterium]HDK17402.1 tetratricopeptide repeat protein [Nitrospirota bacterium]HDK81050.1 tetratricopeptide repeat protein [Nitrospirota bacterium]